MMPDGRTHAGVTILTTAYITASFPLWYPWTLSEGWWMVPGALYTLLVSPDLDVDEGNISSFFLRRIFPPLSWAWRLFWMPYSKLVPHRHPVSHLPVFSTLVRFLYLTTLGGLTLFWVVPRLPLWGVVYFLLGASICDFHHWFLDVITRKFD